MWKSAVGYCPNCHNTLKVRVVQAKTQTQGFSKIKYAYQVSNSDVWYNFNGGCRGPFKGKPLAIISGNSAEIRIGCFSTSSLNVFLHLLTRIHEILTITTISLLCHVRIVFIYSTTLSVTDLQSRMFG
jgi:hypothetical protein